MNSLATTCWSTYGPEVPNGVIATITVDSPARAPTSSSDQSPVKSVTTRSAPAITSGVAVSPSSTDLLSAARYPNNAPGAPPADHCRIGSPCGGSILTTSAPASVNILPQYDAAMPLDNSTIRQPANGAIGSSPSVTRSTLLSCPASWHGLRSRRLRRSVPRPAAPARTSSCVSTRHDRADWPCARHV